MLRKCGQNSSLLLRINVPAGLIWDFPHPLVRPAILSCLWLCCRPTCLCPVAVLDPLCEELGLRAASGLHGSSGWVWCGCGCVRSGRQPPDTLCCLSSTILEEEKVQQEERMRMESRRQVTVSWDSGGSDEAPPKVAKAPAPRCLPPPDFWFVVQAAAVGGEETGRGYSKSDRCNSSCCSLPVPLCSTLPCTPFPNLHLCCRLF